MSHQYCIRKEIDITKYTEIRKLGHGSFGYVSLVQEKGTGNLYALKTLKKLSDDDESQYREIEIMMFSNNPTIIRCFGYLTKEDKIYILMEYASKGSLDTVLKNIQNGIGPEEYTNTTRQIILIGIARAMKYLHERNIVHRDLKPGNILLDDKFHPIVSDFGQSKFLDAGDPFAQSQICGTYLYMAPEAWGKNEYDGKKADVFSFGILMYEVVYDSSPYNEFLQKKTKEEINRLMIKISNDNYRPTIIDKNNKNLQDLIQQCWAENPIERPTFDEILNKLTNETILNDVDINDVEMYSEDINSTYDLYDDFLKKIESLETKNMQLTDENERFSNDINILRSKIDELNNENQLLTSKTCKFNINNHLLSNLNKKLTTKNQQLTERIHDLEISVYATPNINDFNSLPLKMQQFIIAKEVNMNYTGINAYFIKINNLLLYLLENKNLQYYNCFEIYHKNKEFLLSEITEECHIILTYKTIEILDNMDLLNSDKFKDLLKVFNKFSIEIRYPSESFVHMLDKTSKLSSLFNKNQCIIGLFISDKNGVDLKIENENKISYIHFDSSVKSIRCSSINFDYRSSIKYIHIPSSLTNIGYYAFQKYSSLKEITIPDSVTIIRDNAFNGCSSLKKVIIPNSVKTIGAGAFRSCTLLEKIALPNSITAIEVDTFRECTSLKEIDIPNSVIDIKDNAFYKCQNLENLSLHYNLENIHSYAFSECTSLRHVYFPSSVKNLNHAAFQHCTNLYSIDLKSSPLTIGYSVFDGCSNLNEVEVYEGTSIYTWGFPKKTIVKTLKK